jgi:hypothetical protein
MTTHRKNGWIKEIKKELNTTIDGGTLNNKGKTRPIDVVVSTPEANTVKLDQDGNIDKLKVHIFAWTRPSTLIQEMLHLLRCLC